MDPAVAKLMHDHPEPLLHSVALAPPTFLPPPGKAKAADADNAFAGRDGDKATARRPFVSGQLQSAFGEQLTNFGLFRTVELIKPFKAAATREQQRELLLRYANELGADLLLIPRVSRHDVSFVAASGWWIPSTLVCSLFWWPTFWIADEVWAATVEMEWELVFVRNGQTLWGPSRQIARTTTRMDDFDRGWDLLGPWGIPLFTHSGLGVEESNFRAAGERLLPSALALAQGKLLAEIGTHLRATPITTRGVEAKNFALVIGVDQPSPDSPRRLLAANKDATAMGDYLLDPKGGNTERSGLSLLRNEQATLESVNAFLNVRMRKLAPNDHVTIYFAGYGATDNDGRGYLLLADSDPSNLPATALSLTALALALEQTPAESATIYLDASFGPSPVGRTWNRERSGDGLNPRYLQRLTDRRGHLLLRASDTQQVALEYEAEGHGLFTLYLLEALYHANLDDNPTQVSLAEAFSWVHERVPPGASLLGSQQTPQLHGVAEEADRRSVSRAP